MAEYEFRQDPLTGRPMSSITARGNERGMSEVLGQIRGMEEGAVMPSELRRLEATSLAGRRGRSSQVVEDIAGELRRQNQPFRVEVLGKSTARFHLLGTGTKGKPGVGIGATFDLPLQVGGMVRGLPSNLRDPETLGFQQAVRTSEFVARGRLVRMGEKVVPSTWIEAVGHDVLSELRTPAVGDQGLRDIAGRIQSTITGPGYEGLVWSGATRVPIAQGVDMTGLAPTGYQARAGSIYDLFQMGTVGVFRGEGVGAARLIDEFADRSKFPIGRGGVFEPSAALQHIQGFLEEAEALGIKASDRAIKAEAALAGNLGVWNLGDIVPFGESADPSRQAYQRLAISQLAGRRGFDMTPVSTPVVEAMKTHMTRTTGGSGRWGVEARLALVMDPRFEQAVAGSGGGAIVTKQMARELGADITQQANFESGRWLGMMERGGGRVISPAEVGTPIITSMGTKHTVASIQDMTKARMAVGWSTFLKGKTPEAMREAVIRDVVDQMGQVRTGTTGRYMKSNIEARAKFQSSLIDKITNIFDAKTGETVRGGVPQLQIGPRAEFGTAQLTDLNKAIDVYNRQLKSKSELAQQLGLQEIKKGFEISTMKIGGERMRAMFVQASVMRRLEASEVVTKAVGAWVRPAEQTAILGFADAEYYSTKQGDLKRVVNKLYNPRGIKMGLKDLTNLELYKTKEASELADLYTSYIKNWSKFEKEQLYNTVAPFFGVPGKEASALGFPDIKGAIEFEEFSRRYKGKFQQTAGKGIERTAQELQGTIFEAGGRLRTEGMAIKLPWEIEVGGITKAGEKIGGTPTRQLYLPGVETYRGIMKDPSMITPEAAAYMGKLERAHERLFLGLAAENPSQKKVQALARKYYDTLGAAFGGKKGLWSYLSTARMAHSGYLGLTPGGMGPSAKALGTALESNTMAHISESTAKQMGVYHLFGGRRGDKMMYGRVSAYPGIGPTMESVMQFRMVKDSELGSKRLRISNLAALTMFRDFDADKAGVTFLTGDRAQELSKNFYEKTVIPRMKWYERIVKDDPELAAVMGEESEYSKILARNIGDTRAEAKAARMGYGEMIALTELKDVKIQAKLSEAIERKYTTKALTGPVDWYLNQFRMVAEQRGFGADVRSLGLAGAVRGKALGGYGRRVGGILGLIEQQATISKGAGVAGGVQGIMRLMSTSYEVQTEAGQKAFREAIESGAQNLLEMTGAKTDDPRAIAAALGGRGEYRWLSTHKRRMASMRQLLATGTVRDQLLKQMDAGVNVFPEFVRHMAKGGAVGAEFEALGTVFMDAADRQSRLSGDGLQALNQASAKIQAATGFTRSMGRDSMQWGTDIAGVEARAARIKAEEAMMATINQQEKVAGRAAGMTVLDRASRWWTRAETPMWQKAGVITGAALILGAVAKNTLFPGYGGGTDRVIHAAGRPAGPPPVIIAAPPSDGAYQGPTGPPVAPHRAHRKPGGIWGYVQEQVGFGPESYGLDTGRGTMPMAKPIFGPRKSAPGVGVDLGYGIADSGSRPMMLTGPPIGGGSGLPPAPATTTASAPEIPYTTPLGEPPARMQLPDHMRGGMTISGMQPPMGGMPSEDIGGIMSQRLGGEVSMTMDRWDPADGLINRMVDINSQGLSSFT